MGFKIEFKGAQTLTGLRNQLNSIQNVWDNHDIGRLSLNTDSKGDVSASLKSRGAFSTFLYKIKCHLGIGGARTANGRLLAYLREQIQCDPSMRGLESAIQFRFKAIDAKGPISLGAIKGLLSRLSDDKFQRDREIRTRFSNSYRLALVNNTVKLPEGLQLSGEGLEQLIGLATNMYEEAYHKSNVTIGGFLQTFNQQLDSLVEKITGDQRVSAKASMFMAKVFEHPDSHISGLLLEEKQADDLSRLFRDLSTTFADETEFASSLDLINGLNLRDFSGATAGAFWPKFGQICDVLSKEDLTQLFSVEYGAINNVSNLITDIITNLEKIAMTGTKEDKLLMGGESSMLYVMVCAAVSRMDQNARATLFNALMQEQTVREMQYCRTASVKAFDSQVVLCRNHFISTLVEELGKACGRIEDANSIESRISEKMSGDEFDKLKKNDVNRKAIEAQM